MTTMSEQVLAAGSAPAEQPAPDKMILTYKYRLNPERRQHRALEAILEQQRQLYNAALQERIEAYDKSSAIARGKILRANPILYPENGVLDIKDWRAQRAAAEAALTAEDRAILSGTTRAARSVSEVDQSRALTIIRAGDETFSGVQRRIQRGTLKRLDRAYKAFFRRAKAGAGAASGFPKFKGRDYFDGFGFDAFAQIVFAHDGLRFAGMCGKLRVHMDRALPEVPNGDGALEPSIKNIWFKRAGRRWYCGFQVEVARAAPHGHGRPIGADWGTSVLAHLSTGEIIANQRHGEALQNDLARAQRRVSRAKKGSRGRMKARRQQQAVARRIANRRRNGLDQVSARLTKQFHTIAIEDLNVKGLMDAERPGETLPRYVKTRRNREALDTAPALLRQMLTYKAARNGARLIVVDPNNTSQDCAWCGRLHFKELTDPEHVCTTPGPFENMRAPRKLNAARVILKRALSLVDDDRGGPVPGGVPSGTNAGTGSRRLGNTQAGQPARGRRGPSLNDQGPLLTHARDARDPRLRSSPGW